MKKDITIVILLFVITSLIVVPSVLGTMYYLQYKQLSSVLFVYPCQSVDIETHYTDYWTKSSAMEARKEFLSEEEIREALNPHLDDNEIMMLYPRIAWLGEKGTCYKLNKESGDIRGHILLNPPNHGQA